MQYLEAERETEGGGCVFCAILEDGAPAEERILARGELAFVTQAKFPYNPGHLLILPVRHTGDVEDLTAGENAEIATLLQRSLRVLREASEPQGFNIGLNLGGAAGAGIPDHLHWHVVPRWSGDTNFMPVIAGTRVLPELLAETFRRLRPGFEP